MTSPKPLFGSLDESLKALSHKSRECVHIAKLRFPNYKGLASNEELQFGFAITALLGRNGTNKSSILYALYGCPKGATIADFWFETKVDGIPETRDGLKQSVTHTYVDNHGSEVECIKARAPRHDDPDYWESVKPTRRYGFPPGATRQPPIELDVLHLDFRGQLPAFDKYFYFPDAKHLAQRAKAATGQRRRSYRKQDYLRNRSKQLLTRLNAAEVMGDFELKAIGYILERTYTEGVIVEHDLFHGHSGTTIRFMTQSLAGGYSEAFAGSGESSVALLVHQVLNAAAGSLILLDEPETSLHPTAQVRMLEFLASQAVKKDLQIVMATHSTHLAKLLPQSAIRVLVQDDTGAVRISSTNSAREALHEIAILPAGRRVFVEDERARHVMISAIKAQAPQALSELRVEVSPGGTAMCYREMLAHSRSGSNSIYFVLDGDHRPDTDAPARSLLPQGVAELDKLIDALTRGPNQHGPNLQLIDVDDRTRFIEFLSKYVRYLPGQTPEQLVWDEDEARKLLGATELDSSISEEQNPKTRLRRAAEKSAGLDDDAVFKVLLAKFLQRRGTDEWKQLMDIVRHVRGL